MSPSHRINTARLLLRSAKGIEFREAWSMIGPETPDEVFDELERRSADPKRWLTHTKLYRALTADLKVNAVLPAPQPFGTRTMRERLDEKIAEQPVMIAPDEEEDEDWPDSCSYCGGYHSSREADEVHRDHDDMWLTQP